MSAQILLRALFFPKQFRQTAVPQGTGAAPLVRADLRRIAAAVAVMHFLKQSCDLAAKLVGQFDILPVPGLKIVQRGAFDPTTEHFFQTHRLRSRLQTVAIRSLAFSVFVFHRQYGPLTRSAVQRNAVFGLREHHGVALAADAEHGAFDRHPAHRQFVPAPFGQRAVVYPVVLHPAFGSAPVLRPQILNMDQRPLPAAEAVMLYPGKKEIVVLVIHLRSLPDKGRGAPPALSDNHQNMQVRLFHHGG